jgi:hypothetical protein
MSTARLGVAAAGGGGGGSVKIPPSAMEVVRSLKEIVENSEDEIYATLKECNMDLNETAQRLLNQGVIDLTCFFQQSFFCDIYICSIFPSSRCEVVFSVSVAKSLALWFVSSVHTTLSVFSAARQNLKTTIFCLFTRRAQLSLSLEIAKASHLGVPFHWDVLGPLLNESLMSPDIFCRMELSYMCF